MPSRGWVILLGVALLGILALGVTASRDERRTAFTLGVAPGGVAAELGPGAQACQTPVAVAEDFTHVTFLVGTFQRPGQPLEVSVRSASGEASGRLPGGYGDGLKQAVAVGTVEAGAPAAVCIRNLGRRRVALYGGAGAAARLTRATVDGRAVDTDLTLVFERDQRSALAAVPNMFERASRFRPAWVAPWIFWVLAALTLLGVPVALALALRVAEREDTASVMLRGHGDPAPLARRAADTRRHDPRPDPSGVGAHRGDSQARGSDDRNGLRP